MDIAGRGRQDPAALSTCLVRDWAFPRNGYRSLIDVSWDDLPGPALPIRRVHGRVGG